MNIIILTIIIVLVLIAIIRRFSNGLQTVTAKIKTTYLDQEIFTYTILLADATQDQEDDKGKVSMDDFMKAFESFPWNDQIRFSNILKVQSPTFTVHDQMMHRSLMISMMGEPDSPKIGIGYLVGIVSNPNNAQKDTVTMTNTQNKEQVRVLIQKFFDRDQNILKYLKLMK